MNRASVFEADEPLHLEITARAEHAESALRVKGTIFDAEGVPVESFFTAQCESLRAGDRKMLRILLGGLRLGPGRYFFSLKLVRGTETTGNLDHDAISDVLPFEVAGLKDEGGTLGTWHRSWGPIRFQLPQMLSVGSADMVAEVAR